eukprot:TRINITY_DN7781_c3_g1_i1.p1 TRINITY_DN7781_c3_g1~~TRINITY_DN7781_c3_g1_i1.p1  ORF type:complete len:102 (+),score=6.49 TRINITY_DN7781_c3_g1_i1:1-306(+)
MNGWILHAYPQVIDHSGRKATQQQFYPNPYITETINKIIIVMKYLRIGFYCQQLSQQQFLEFWYRDNFLELHNNNFFFDFQQVLFSSSLLNNFYENAKSQF